MEKYSLAKEFLLNLIESTAIWRAQKAHQFPDQKNENLLASNELNELYNYVEKLSEDHKIFYYFLGTSDESVKLRIETEIRMFGFQNKTESPKQFIVRLVKEKINEKLIDDILDRRNEFGYF